jgi:hypothetical protein
MSALMSPSAQANPLVLVRVASDARDVVGHHHAVIPDLLVDPLWLLAEKNCRILTA